MLKFLHRTINGNKEPLFLCITAGLGSVSPTQILTLTISWMTGWQIRLTLDQWLWKNVSILKDPLCNSLNEKIILFRYTNLSLSLGFCDWRRSTFSYSMSTKPLNNPEKWIFRFSLQLYKLTEKKRKNIPHILFLSLGLTHKCQQR